MTEGTALSSPYHEMSYHSAMLNAYCVMKYFNTFEVHYHLHWRLFNAFYLKGDANSNILVLGVALIVYLYRLRLLYVFDVSDDIEWS